MFQTVVAEIESGSVFFDMAVADTSKSALRRLEASPVLREERRNLGLSHENMPLYLANARDAFAHRVPVGYANPNDGALAAYISLLARVPDKDVQRFVSRVAASQRSDLRKAVWVARHYVSVVPSFTMDKASNAPRGNLRRVGWHGMDAVSAPVRVSSASQFHPPPVRVQGV